jgi:hypothetical protein
MVSGASSVLIRSESPLISFAQVGRGTTGPTVTPTVRWILGARKILVIPLISRACADFRIKIRNTADKLVDRDSGPGASAERTADHFAKLPPEFEKNETLLGRTQSLAHDEQASELLLRLYKVTGKLWKLAHPTLA